MPVEIGSHAYQCDLRGFVRRPLASIRQLQDSSREPSEASFDNQGVWKRTVSDFIMGAGQLYLDQEDEADRRRFRTSKGVNIWERRHLGLLPRSESLHTFASAAPLAAAVAGDALYTGMGAAGVRWVGTTSTALSGVSGIIRGFVALAGRIYCATSAGLFRATAGQANFSGFGSAQPDLIGTGGGRLIGTTGAAVYEVLNDGSTTPIYDHFEGAGFTWRSICTAPNGIYLFGDDAGRSTGYLLTVVDASGQLAPPYPVLQMPDGEFIRDVLFFGGVLVLATNHGVRLATINGSGFLTAGPLIATGDTASVATDGTDVWFTWSQFDATSSGLGRLRPSRFTDALVPAYASDQMTNVTADATGVVVYQGVPWFAVGAQLFRPHPTEYVTEGQLWTGVISYGTPEPKVVHSMEAFFDALPSGAEVRIDVLDGLGGAVLAGGVVATTAGTTSARGSTALPITREEVELRITLKRATSAQLGPVVHRWTLRSLVTPFRGEEIILPLLLHQSVDHFSGGRFVRQSLDPRAEFDYLHGLMIDRAVVPVRIGGRTEDMLIDAVGMASDIETVRARDWVPRQDWFDGTWAVRLLTMEPSS